jgi:ferrous iron transport protein B
MSLQSLSSPTTPLTTPAAEETAAGSAVCTLCRHCPWAPESDGGTPCACEHMARMALLPPAVPALPAPLPFARPGRLEAILTHRFGGLFIFLGVMYLVFSLVQRVSAPYLDWLDTVIHGPVRYGLQVGLTAVGAPDWLLALVADGIVAGVGGVIVFVPGLFLMHLSLGLLEQSGYLPRAAQVMDRWLQVLGLRGRSFLPMILGFGCNVPAIYATRTIADRPTRLITALMIPFMSCSARLPIYVIFGLAFFPRHAGWVIWGLYMLGILVAAVVGMVFSRLVFRGHERPEATALPPLRWPSWRSVVGNAVAQSGQFVKNAFTIILVVSMLLWLGLHLPWHGTDATDPEHSLFGRASALLAPTLAPAGFGTWQAAGALLTGLVAKEMVISSLSQLYLGPETAPADETPMGLGDIVTGFGLATVKAGQQLLDTLTPGIRLFPATAEAQDVALSRRLPAVFSPAAALAFLVFVLTYVPCVATIAALAHEFGWRWAALTVALQTTLPWVLAVVVFQIGRWVV